MDQISVENRSFKAFRLEIGSSILRNNGHIANLLTDIDAHQHIVELCDTYAMRLLLAWLTTKYGCTISQSAIQTSKPDAVPLAERFFLSCQIYPFVSSVRLNNEDELLKSASAFLDAAFTPSIQLVGSLYEHLTSFQLDFKSDGSIYIQSNTDTKQGRRKKGQFYTPPWVVDYCLEKSLQEHLHRLIRGLQQPVDIDRNAAGYSDFKGRYSILDPACGTGNFLTGVLTYLEKHAASLQDLLETASYSLHGRDIDGKAVSITIWSVFLLVAKAFAQRKRQLDSHQLLENLQRNIRVSDSVFESLALTGKTTENPEGSKGEFDLVITNPPYISFGSRNQEKLLPSTAAFLRTNFPLSAEYKIRLNAIFQEVALNYLNENGSICLFIPNSFLTGKGYTRLRSALLKRTRIVSLSELPENTIKSAVVGRWCVAVYKRNLAKNASLDYPVELTTLCSADSSRRDGVELILRPQSYSLPASRLVTRDQNRFRLVFEKLDERLALKLEALAPLNEIVRGHTGIRSRIGQQSIVASNQVDEFFRRGLKSGSSVKPFSVSWHGDWLKIDPKLLFAGGFDSIVIGNPKILLRQTADRIIAAFDDQGFYHLNNVHSFSPQRVKDGKHKVDLHFLVGLMNSRLWLYLYRMKTREDGRALAQIDIETVETMPIPLGATTLARRICELAISLSKVEAEMERRNLQNELDTLVYRIYGLEPDEIVHVESRLESKLKDESVSCVPHYPDATLTTMREAL